MSRKRGMEIGGVHVAYIAIYAAFVALLTLIPAMPIPLTPFTWTVAAPFYTLTGFIFGPIAGSISAFVASLIQAAIAPWSAILSFGTAFVVLPYALIGGGIIRGDWKLPTAVMVFVNVAFILLALSVVNFAATPQQWWWIIEFMLALYIWPIAICLAAPWLGKWLRSWDPKKMSPALFLASLAAALGVDCWGGGLFIAVYKYPLSILPIWIIPTIVPRVIQALSTAIIGIPLLLSLKRAGRLVFAHWRESAE